MYTDNISTFLWQIHRREFQGFAVEFFTVLWISRKSSSIIIGFYLSKAIGTWFSCIYSHLKTSLSIRFLDIPKTVFLRSNLLRKVKFFCTVMIYFFLGSCFFPYTKKLLKVSDHSIEEIQHESKTLTMLFSVYFLYRKSWTFWATDKELPKADQEWKHGVQIFSICSL